MKVSTCLVVFLFSFILISCSKVAEPVKKISVGTSLINYQGDQQVDSLIIPPDLTKPNSQGLFSENVGTTDKSFEVTTVQNVELKRD